jgi:hypothetical protein
LYSLSSTPGQKPDTQLLLEPALTQNLTAGYVRSLNLANFDRTRATAPAGFLQSSLSLETTALLVNQMCLTGDLVLEAGYNISLQQIDRTSSLLISAVQGAGAGEPCNEVPLTATETPPAGSQLLSGGPACNEVFSSVGGVSASVLRLLSGSGVTIKTDATMPNTLSVVFDLHDLAACKS